MSYGLNIEMHKQVRAFLFLKIYMYTYKAEYVDLGEGGHLKMSLGLVSHLAPKSECSGMPAAGALLFLGYVELLAFVLVNLGLVWDLGRKLLVGELGKKLYCRYPRICATHS